MRIFLFASFACLSACLGLTVMVKTASFIGGLFGSLGQSPHVAAAQPAAGSVPRSDGRTSCQESPDPDRTELRSGVEENLLRAEAARDRILQLLDEI